MMLREDALRAIYPHLEERIVVTIMGAVAAELYTIGHRHNFFYLEHAMGMASSMGLGIALAMPQEKVIVLDGDGSLLMNLSVLAAIGREAPPRFLHVILNDGAYESTGGQPTATAANVDLRAVAIGCGISRSLRVETESELEDALGSWRTSGGPMLIDVAAVTERTGVRPRYDPTYYKYRLRDALAGVAWS